MVMRYSNFFSPNRDASYSVLHLFDKGELFTIQIFGETESKQLHMVSVSRGDGSGDEFNIMARIVGSDSGKLYHAFYDAKMKSGTIAENVGPNTISMHQNGPTFAVKNGPSREGVIKSLLLGTNPVNPLEFRFDWSNGYLPKKAEVLIHGVEKTGDPGWLLIRANVLNVGRYGKDALIRYDYHKRSGSVIVVQG